MKLIPHFWPRTGTCENDNVVCVPLPLADFLLVPFFAGAFLTAGAFFTGALQ